MELVYAVAHRAAVMNRGRIEAVGQTAEIMSDKALLARAGLEPPPQVAALAALDLAYTRRET